MNELISVFIIALLGSAGHCIGMCGGIVLAYSSKLESNKIIYHLSYNLGRVSMYVALGIVVGFIGSMFSLNIFFKSSLFVLAGICMILAGLSLFGKISFFKKLEYNIQNTRWYKSIFQKYLQIQSVSGIFILGMLNGLLPCGFVYAFLFKAASSGSILSGALIMLSFGLGTIFALFLFGVISRSILDKNEIRKLFLNLASIAIIIFGVLMVYRGIMIFGGGNVSHGNHGMHIMDANATKPMHMH
ncbi:sulfite exporter TauE/SafE family protein [Helicobacter ibis]|uniref:Sulfite exporter TauE/SafE family protein n=1 Tax=Helicobacter ibis TaxID=2962633 RepID=A0ABT4VFU9_9HELI|nr:sulfite exporter TauE/SafE family protein [Helicobacter ibis]MDA3969584.1 sulfite exporter TauE/SafE family protein [Helicobacter ibis]